MCDYIVVHSVRVRTEFAPEVFCRLTTLGPAFLLPGGSKNKRKAFQVCQCECGAIVATLVDGLRSGNSRSCGCLRKETTRRTRTTHGRRESPEYRSWAHMISRCTNPKYDHAADYSERGIIYCERWKKFENFFVDMGLRPSLGHSIDRFPDLNGNYEPSNCRWATRTEQANNTRRNRIITIDDRSDTLANWCKLYAMDYERARARLNTGWEPLLALTTPIRQQKC